MLVITRWMMADAIKALRDLSLRWNRRRSSGFCAAL